ncbi:unnamed protein product, partial [Mesorhabditis belari]|uniref:EGF-like domain-containing protein n=1 Tax=Mesorhabditis belari TaxID=2138241 RepID=A0AAF3EFS7_9BILA
MEALLILCCFGGQPYVDLHLEKFHSHHVIDPTDWMATDIAGELIPNISATIPGLEKVIKGGTPLLACDLYNISFTSSADQTVFSRNNGSLECRCPPEYSGSSCEIPPPIALPLIQSESYGSALPGSMILIVGVVLLCLFCVTFLMMRGCFCDCFGPLVWGCRRGGDDESEKPLDRECLQKMLNECKRHEVRREMLANEQEYGGANVATISEGMAQPYNTTIIPPPGHGAPSDYTRRPPSPPPSYTSLAGSAERLNAIIASQTRHSTQI